MSKNQLVLADSTIDFLNSESRRIASSVGLPPREVQVVASIYDQKDVRAKGKLPIWSKLYASLEPKEQSFGVALQYANKLDEALQMRQVFMVVMPTLALTLIALTTMHYLAVFIPAMVLAYAGFWGGLIYFLFTSLRRNFLKAVEISGDAYAGERFLLKKRAAMMGADPSDAITNPWKYANWMYRACIPPDNRTLLL